MNETFIGTFKKYAHYGFIIPDERDSFGGDFYVSSKNIGNYDDGERVEARILDKHKGKKPEAKIVRLLNRPVQKVEDKYVEGVYSGGNGNFGFIDVEGEEKGYFVFEKYKNGANDGDKVRAEVVVFKGRKEGKIIEILSTEKQVLVGIYKDQEKFGFVIPNDGSEDIFIAGGRKNGAKDGSSVKVQIIKKGIRRREGMILRGETVN